MLLAATDTKLVICLRFLNLMPLEFLAFMNEYVVLFSIIWSFLSLTWRLNQFSFRELFACPILFSLWRIRRSWLKNILKRCVNREVQCEIFRRLGEVLYSIWSKETDQMAILQELFQDFVDQTDFVQYFKSFWVPKIGTVSAECWS